MHELPRVLSAQSRTVYEILFLLLLLAKKKDVFFLKFKHRFAWVGNIWIL